MNSGLLEDLFYTGVLIWLTAHFLWVLTKFSASSIRSLFKESANTLQNFMPRSVPSELSSTKTGGPPKLAEYTLYFFLSRRDRINLIGDLEEEFRDVEAKFGRRPATIWYCKQVVTSIGPQVRNALVRWASLAWLGEWVRRHL